MKRERRRGRASERGLTARLVLRYSFLLDDKDENSSTLFVDLDAVGVRDQGCADVREEVMESVELDRRSSEGVEES